MPSTAGHIIAPPMPMSARETMSASTDWLRPPAREKSAKIADPMKKIRLRPNMSARRPPVTIRTPKISA